MYAALMGNKEAMDRMIRDPRIDLDIESGGKTVLQMIDDNITKLKATASKVFDSMKVRPWYLLENLPSEDDNAMSENFSSLLESGDMTDFVIKCGVDTMKCHKLVLAARSSMMKTMLDSGMREAANNSVDLSEHKLPDQARTVCWTNTFAQSRIVLCHKQSQDKTIRHIYSEFLWIILMATVWS